VPIRSTNRRALRVLVLAVTALALALGAAPAEAAKKSTQVRKWTTATKTVTPGSTVKLTVKVVSGGKASPKRTVVLQRYSGGRWVKAAQVRSSKYGNAVLRLKVGSKAGVTHRVRVRVAATGSRKGTVTRGKKVAVRAKAVASALDQRILALVNQARASDRKCGSATYRAQPPLRWNAKLDAAAQGHAADMASKNYFSHTSKDGSSVADRVSRRGYDWRAVGENIAAGQRSAEDVMDSWLRSAGHCRNIMSPSYTELGVGYATTSRRTYPTYWVQNFGAPR